MAAGTGCTVILCPQGAVTGVDIRGGSPGTRDTAALDPLCNRSVVHAVVLTGGSAFGLDAAGGVMKKLEEEKIGRDVLVTVVPNVCAAVLFDLKFGAMDVRPDGAMGYAACEAALQGGPLQEGNFGAGTGCTVGKIRGAKFAMKGGIGCCAYRQGDLMVGAVVACNAMGDVWDHGQIIAGARNDENTGFANSEEWLIAHGERQLDVFSEKFVGQNTVIGCVVTNAALTKPRRRSSLPWPPEQASPAPSVPPTPPLMGTVCSPWPAAASPPSPDAVGILAARAVEEAICRGVRAAESLHGRPAIRDLPFGKDKNS